MTGFWREARGGFPAGILALLLIQAAIVSAAVAGAGPEPHGESGPFEERNQFLFNLLFLAFPARGGALLPAGEQEILLSQTYANTFVGSETFFTHLDPASDSRQQLTRAFVAAAQTAQGGRSLFFVDGEGGRTELRYRTGLAGWFEAGVEIPFLSYRGGAFDGLIETYHEHAGFYPGGRDLYLRDRAQIALTLGGDSYFTDRSPALYELGDISLFGRFPLTHGAKGDLALSLGLKLPTGDPEHLAGSGSLDAGIEIEGTRRWRRHQLHLAAGWVRTGDWSLLPRFDPAEIASGSVSYQFFRREAISWIGQLQFQTSVFRGRTANDLSGPSTEILGGARWSRGGRWSYEAAFIENLFNQNNGVDIGLRVGAQFRVRRR